MILIMFACVHTYSLLKDKFCLQDYVFALHRLFIKIEIKSFFYLLLTFYYIKIPLYSSRLRGNKNKK